MQIMRLIRHPVSASSCDHERSTDRSANAQVLINRYPICEACAITKTVEFLSMTSKKEKQTAALKAREEALRFLAENPDEIAVSNIVQAAPRVTRDNTFEQVKEARTNVVAQPQNLHQPPIQKELPSNSIKLTQGWRVNGSFFIHELTGCTIRGRSPPEVEGGLLCFKALPPGWRLLKNPDVNSPYTYFYWNPSSNQISWTFPHDEDRSVETLELAEAISSKTMAQNRSSLQLDEVAASRANDDVSSSSTVMLQMEVRPQKRSRASLFAT